VHLLDKLNNKKKKKYYDMQICSLASGSRGNSILIESNDSRILIDAGLSALKIKNALMTLRIEPNSVDAIVITHAHRDHVNGAGVFSNQFKIPVWGHPDTLDRLSYLFSRNQNVKPWTGSFKIKDMNLKPFAVSHDAIPTVGYKIQSNSKTIVICTDIGMITSGVENNLKEADLLVIESNHDPDMLRNGPYPLELKNRISSNVGHLSNYDTGALLKRILNHKMEQILLAHLSEENNSPDLAKKTVLEFIGSQFEDQIAIIEQQKMSPIFQI
jgi:phosphoribosyl 1,2-cyclic phosphodiesterase